MPRPKRRNRDEADLDRKIGAAVAFIRARDARQTQLAFAKRLGISRGKLAEIETGRIPLSAVIGWKFCRELDCNPTWVCQAGNSGIPNAFPEIEPFLLARLEQMMAANAASPFRNLWPSIAWMVESQSEISPKNVLTDNAERSMNVPVKSEIQRLVSRANVVLARRGSKAELARVLHVDPARIWEWLSGKTEPGGEYTLRLLHWVEQRERQDKQCPALEKSAPCVGPSNRGSYEKPEFPRKSRRSP